MSWEKRGAPYKKGGRGRVNKKRISNIEQGMSNYEVFFPSIFIIPCSIFCGSLLKALESLNPGIQPALLWRADPLRPINWAKNKKG